MPNKRMTFLFAAGFAGVAAPLFLILGGCGGDRQTVEIVRPVKTMVLDAAASTVPRNYPGTVQASEKATMAFRVSGPLIEFSAKEGQEVDEGAILARIDPRDFTTDLANERPGPARVRKTSTR